MFERYYQELLSFLARLTGDRDDAADVAQETFVRALALQAQQAARLPGEDTPPVRAPRALLYRIARNLVVDQHRRDTVRDHDDIDGVEMAAPACEEPEARLDSRRRAEALLATIEALPPRCREAFILHKFDGLPHGEIAARMGISRNMVEKHVINGMIACKRCLDALDGAAAPGAVRGG